MWRWIGQNRIQDFQCLRWTKHFKDQENFLLAEQIDLYPEEEIKPSLRRQLNWKKVNSTGSKPQKEKKNVFKTNSSSQLSLRTI